MFKTTEQQRQRAMDYYYANREAVAARYKTLPEDIKERRRARTRRWRAANKVSKAIYDKLWRESNSERWRELQRKQRNTPEGKIASNLRHRLREFLRATSSHISADFGCSPKQLRAHIESQFTRRMSWDNYGEWHVDHIVPCSAFDLTRLTQMRLCFNWQNLRPTWAAENLAKSSKLIYPQLSLPFELTPGSCNA
jgi:hypothetical protein